jgi:ABC-type transporter Mla MlaB component
VGSLEVSVATGASGPVLVLAGEADFTSITRLDEALTAQISGQAVQLIIDAANLRYADSASMRTLVMAAMKARTPGRQRDAAGSAAAGSQDARFAVRRRDALDPAPCNG